MNLMDGFKKAVAKPRCTSIAAPMMAKVTDLRLLNLR